jgi:hypothetical protein
MIPAGTFLGLTKVKIDEKIGLIDKTGKFIWGPL